MKDEIKEINIPENVLVALGDLTYGALNYYKATETVKVRYNTLLDCIINLQKCYCNRTDCSGRIKDSKKYDSLLQKYEKLQQENEKLLKKSYSDDVKITKAIEKLESIKLFGLRSGKTLFSTLINESIDILNSDNKS